MQFFLLHGSNKMTVTKIEETAEKQLNKCLQGLYLSLIKFDGTLYGTKSLSATRAALARAHACAVLKILISPSFGQR